MMDVPLPAPSTLLTLQLALFTHIWDFFSRTEAPGRVLFFTVTADIFLKIKQ